MIHLITGLPGSGKTLYALNYVEHMREGREVYYNGINDLKLPWIALDDPKQWAALPPGAIVVIDEAQSTFRPRGQGAAVPDHVAALETHRHSGHDLIVITQHPMLLDSSLRRLVGRHFHVVRTFGMQRATVHEWGAVKEQCDKSRSDSVQHLFSYPAASFDWYHSAEVHTHKRRVPARLLMLLLFPVAIGAVVYAGYALYQSNSTRVTKSLGSNAPVVPGALPDGAIAPRKSGTPGAVVRTSADYLAERVPVLASFPHTAPVYAEITKPKQAPVPVACVESKLKGCVCYTQQGTRLPGVAPAVCTSIVANGFFMDWVDPFTPLPNSPAVKTAANGAVAPVPVSESPPERVEPSTVAFRAPGRLSAGRPSLVGAAPLVEAPTSAPAPSAGASERK